MDKAELVDKLVRADEDAFFSGVGQDGRKVRVIVVGASALLLNDLSATQKTKDVDIYEAELSVRECLYRDPDFNSQCQAFCSCLPYNFEDRLVEIELDTMAITYQTPSVEDLAVMKLYRWEDPDKVDLTAEEFLKKLDWQRLDYLVRDPNEAAASRSAPPERDREFQNLLHNYDEYRRRWKR